MHTGSRFSNDLQQWLKSSRPKTLASLIEVFDERSFAIVILILMIIPALPLPTGGITHIFEVIVALLALEMIAGLKAISLPRRWQTMKLGSIMEKRAIPVIIKRIRWFEDRSGQRWRHIYNWPLVSRLIGSIILVFTAAAFFSPPFTGLDTLPSMGVVIICLGLILNDALFLAAGVLVGSVGTALVIGLSAVVINFVRNLL